MFSLINNYNVLMNLTSGVLKKHTIFLRLLDKCRSSEAIINLHSGVNVNLIEYRKFKQYHKSLSTIIYVFEFLKIKYRDFEGRTHYSQSNYTLITRCIYFYAKLSKFSKTLFSYNSIDYGSNSIKQNIIIFSKPRKQLFLVMYQNKPTFIFTGGLMRLIINEKRKSSKRLYKVAISLIKLSFILITKQSQNSSYILKLNKVGLLRTKIINMLRRDGLGYQFTHIFFSIHTDFTAQKYKTRRSIKKYIKKRFKLNT